jgi:hypothetical protein
MIYTMSKKVYLDMLNMAHRNSYDAFLRIYGIKLANANWAGHLNLRPYTFWFSLSSICHQCFLLLAASTKIVRTSESRLLEDSLGGGVGE